MCMSMLFVHVCTGACRGQKLAQNSLELGLPEIVSCPMWVLEIELLSSARLASFLNC